MTKLVYIKFSTSLVNEHLVGVNNIFLSFLDTVFVNIICSVYVKEGVDTFLKSVMKPDDIVYATGHTSEFLTSKGISVKNTETLSGFRDLIGGRVKTLSPAIFAGILSTRDEKSRHELKDQGFPEFDMVICNLYPFAEAAKSGNLDSMIENIDIGGITLIRAAAKNYRHVTVICDPSDYSWIADQIRKNGSLDEKTRARLALKAFQVAADYDILIHRKLNHSFTGSEFPDDLFLAYSGGNKLRYGENPDQEAYLYSDGSGDGIPNASQLNGKELSYNNILDANSAFETVLDFDEATVVIVKHLIPCGVSSSEDLDIAYDLAFESDPESAYGYVLAINRKLDLKTAKKISKHFTEVVIAPDYDREALDLLRKKKNLRILQVPLTRDEEMRVRSVSNGILLQTPMNVHSSDLELKTSKPATESQLEDLLFAWRVVAHCRSNAIVLAKDLATVGVGAGQTSRVRALRIAGEIAGEKASGSVLASDAFFPFADSVELAHQLGVRAIIQPGGSIRDDEVIKKCEELGIPLYFTGKRVFQH